MMSQLIQTMIPFDIGPLNCGMECGNDDQINQYVNLRSAMSYVDSITNPLEGVDYKQAATSTIQPLESTNSYGQSSMECSNDSTSAATRRNVFNFHGSYMICLTTPMLKDFWTLSPGFLSAQTLSRCINQEGVFVEGIMTGAS
jgi:hypothetical protein